MGVADLVGGAPLKSLSGIFTEASLVVGIDTGMVHTAAVCGASVLGLYSRPDNFSIWSLCRLRACLIVKDAIEKITVEEV